MKLFFDESGQTGCVIPNKSGELYRRNQRFYVLAGIVCNDEDDAIELSVKYKQFLLKHDVADRELKGTEILKPENESMLDDFIESMLDDTHMFICCYDKIFYLASMISTYLLDRKMMVNEPLLYFAQQSALTREDQSIFIEFCKALEKGTSAARRSFVEYLVKYPYKRFDDETNLYLVSAQALLAVYGIDEEIPDFPLPKGKGAYLNDKITHLINLNALGETLLALRVKYGISKDDMDICHDHITEFEEEFRDSLKDEHLRFADSKEETLIQFADNVASVFRRLYTETTEIFGSGEQWNTEKQFYPKKLAKAMKRVTECNIKFVTAISDWALPIAVAMLFDDKTPASYYNDKDFLAMFMSIREQILMNIAAMDYSVE